MSEKLITTDQFDCAGIDLDTSIQVRLTQCSTADLGKPNSTTVFDHWDAGEEESVPVIVQQFEDGATRVLCSQLVDGKCAGGFDKEEEEGEEDEDDDGGKKMEKRPLKSLPKCPYVVGPKE